MQYLQADTAVDVRIGPFVDVGDGFTPETAIGNTPTNLTGVDEAELLKHNGAATTDITSNTWAAVSGCDGWYDLTLTATDTNTEGQLTVVIQDDSVCLPVFAHFMVISQAAWNSLFTTKATGSMDVDVKEISTSATAANNAELAFNGTGYGFTGCTIPTVTTLTGHTAQTGDTYAQLPTNFSDLSITVTTGRVDVAAVGGTTQTANDMSGDVDTLLTRIVGTLAAGTHNPQTGDAYAIVNNGTYGNAQLVRSTTPANTLDVNATGEAGIDLDNTSGTLAKTTDITGFNDLSSAEVNTEVDNAIVTYGLDHLVSAAVIGTDVTDNSIIAYLASSAATADWDTFVNTTDSLQATRDHIGDGTNLTEAGGTGDHLTAIDLPNQTMDITGSLSGSVGSVAAGGITSSSFGAGAIDAAAIATDAVDADALAANAVDEIWAEAMVDLAAGSPSATASVLIAINYLYEVVRNKKMYDGSEDEIVVYKDDGTTKLFEIQCSDDGTDFTANEAATAD